MEKLSLISRIRKAIRMIRSSHGTLSDLLWSAGSNLLLKGLGLATGSLLARLLGPVGRGELASIQLLGLFLSQSGTLGIENALVYYAGQDEEVGSLITSAWGVLLPGSLLWMVLGYILAPIFLRGKEPSIINYARLFLLLIPMAYLSRASRVLQGLKRFDIWSLFRWHKPLLFTGLLIVLGVARIASPYSIAVGFLLISVLGPILILVLLRIGDIELGEFSWLKVRKLLHYGVRSFLGTIPDDLNQRLDQFLMVVWLSEEELGLYIVAVSWSLVLRPFVQAIEMVAFPYVASSSELDKQRSFIAVSVRRTFLTVVLASVVLLLSTPLALPLIFGQDFGSIVPVSMVLVVANGFYSLKMVIGGALRGLGRPEATAYAEVASLGVTLMSLSILLPRIGVMGAAVSSLLAYVLSALVLLYLICRETRLSSKDLLVVKLSDFRSAKHRLLGLWNRLRVME
jgi:O-antigen/teichoic acid export membrane protein